MRACVRACAENVRRLACFFQPYKEMEAGAAHQSKNLPHLRPQPYHNQHALCDRFRNLGGWLAGSVPGSMGTLTHQAIRAGQSRRFRKYCLALIVSFGLGTAMLRVHNASKQPFSRQPSSFFSFHSDPRGFVSFSICDNPLCPLVSFRHTQRFPGKVPNFDPYNSYD